MKIGIMGAMEEEISLFHNKIKVLSQETIGLRNYSVGKLHNRDIVLTFSRWGKVAAASTATTIIEQFGADIIVFTGVAGAVSKSLGIGDVVVATEAMQYDMDISALPGFERFEIPLLGLSRFPFSEKYVKMAVESARNYLFETLKKELDRETLDEFGISEPKAATGLIASGDRFIADSNSTEELIKSLPDLLCIEMEGGAVAQVCYEHNIPLLLVRTISDRADHSAVIDFSAFIKKVAPYVTFGVIDDFIKKV